MQWLLSLETENDMIPICRLMNVFRRKDLKIVTLAMTNHAAGFSMVAVVDSLEGEVDHFFNFLRRMEGIRHVTCYRHETFPKAAFVFVDSEADDSRLAQVLKTFPGAKLIFATQGKYLLEVPAEKRQNRLSEDFADPAFLPFACVKTTRAGTLPQFAQA
jgi:hypothetical protein